MSSESTYGKERNFDKTPEPEFHTQKSPAGDESLFVIQKHDAQQLHFDFRLEIDGVLKSWVLPKGPSMDPAQKRLAIPVEDHPIDYAGFEGVIPEDQYGGGTVMIWDRGSFQNNRIENNQPVSLKQCYEDGKIEISLNGDKISGDFTLVKAKNMDNNWLLIKKGTTDANYDPVSTENRSVVTGRTLKEIENSVK
ncbi:MAG: DNA polymerase ligase N-terminal domain-containing protein [Balneolaceae bacterium]